MTFGQSISTCFKKYASFKGRASRSEFWYFYLFILLVYAIILTLAATVDPLFFSFFALFIFAVILPSYAVTARRLHDTNHSGWLQLLPYPFSLIGNALTASSPVLAIVFSVVGLVLGIYLLVLYCSEGDSYVNEYDTEFAGYPSTSQMRKSVTQKNTERATKDTVETYSTTTIAEMDETSSQSKKKEGDDLSEKGFKVIKKLKD
mgnify:CR=1 FL=1|tara:strand:- start:482 stop:1093 length:612 start_codon:yes stop_codon:yes gene_type:complete